VTNTNHTAKTTVTTCENSNQSRFMQQKPCKKNQMNN